MKKTITKLILTTILSLTLNTFAGFNPKVLMLKAKCGNTTSGNLTVEPESEVTLIASYSNAAPGIYDEIEFKVPLANFEKVETATTTGATTTWNTPYDADLYKVTATMKHGDKYGITSSCSVIIKGVKIIVNGERAKIWTCTGLAYQIDNYHFNYNPKWEYTIKTYGILGEKTLEVTHGAQHGGSILPATFNSIMGGYLPCNLVSYSTTKDVWHSSEKNAVLLNYSVSTK